MKYNMEMAYGVGATVDIYPGGKKIDEFKIFKNMTVLLGSMSLAKILKAPLILAAMAVAPHPLPISNTDFPLTTSGLSKRYLN